MTGEAEGSALDLAARRLERAIAMLESLGKATYAARDDFLMCFVGPTPAAILQVQRDMLVQDMVHLMERHFDGSELGEVVGAIDKLFTGRFDDLISSMQLGRPPRGSNGPAGGHGGPRKPRHLH